MSTVSTIHPRATQEIQAVTEPGWRRGFANLLGNELRMWWGTRKWLVHLLLWLVVLNGLIVLIGLTDPEDPNNPLSLYATLIEVFFQVGAFATAIGVVTTAQGAIVREKQLGTAAWVLSKPVSRNAFVLAKFVAYAFSFGSLAIVVPSAIFYGASMALTGHVPELASFLAAVGILTVHTLFYLALALLLGTLFSTRGPISGVALGLLFGGALPPNLVPQAFQMTLPWSLSGSAVGLALGSELPVGWSIPVIASVLWTVLFLGVALWRFGREEF
ncbi:MAG: ABC transporter permease subunit [Roseiflexaceae bacterium]